MAQGLCRLACSSPGLSHIVIQARCLQRPKRRSFTSVASTIADLSRLSGTRSVITPSNPQTRVSIAPSSATARTACFARPACDRRVIPANRRTLHAPIGCHTARLHVGDIVVKEIGSRSGHGIGHFLGPRGWRRRQRAHFPELSSARSCFSQADLGIGADAHPHRLAAQLPHSRKKSLRTGSGHTHFQAGFDRVGIVSGVGHSRKPGVRKAQFYHEFLVSGYRIVTTEPFVSKV